MENRLQHIRRIFLTGMMGSGKSTVGARLAKALGYPFLDLDAEVEKTAATSVARLFREQGEEAFRSLEDAVLRQAAGRQPVVIALGGGTLLNPRNLETVLGAGILVYLEMDLKELFDRLSDEDRESRPLIERGEEGEWSQFERRFEQRLEGYGSAHIRVDVSGKNPAVICQMVMDRLKLLDSEL